jgi:hypothetical protein
MMQPKKGASGGELAKGRESLPAHAARLGSAQPTDPSI